LPYNFVFSFVLEPLVLPLQYTGFYGDRKKRSNNNKKNIMAQKPSLAAQR
jgi:hypothetical protein